MVEIRAPEIAEVLGYRLTDDGSHVLIGFTQLEGSELTVAITDEHLNEVIGALIAARDTFPANAKMLVGSALPFEAEAVEIGVVKDQAKIVQTFRLLGGGSVSFMFERAMAAKMLETLKALLGERSSASPAAAPRQ